SAPHTLRCAATVFAENHEMILVCIDLRIDAAVYTQVFPQHSYCDGHDLFCVRKRHYRMFEIGHEPGVVLCILTLRDVDYCADDLLHTAIFVATKHIVASMKPAPSAATNAAPEFKFSIFLLAKTGESFYVVDKGLPIVRVHHREDGARLRQLLAQCGADRVRESMIDEDDPLLPHIVNRNTTWQGIDDVL